MEKHYKFSRGTRNIIILGLISCFADISSEMVYPLIPLYLTSVFGATPVLVGIIEGIAESADKNNMGKAFGIHKMLDMAGSATGILIAFLEKYFKVGWKA